MTLRVPGDKSITQRALLLASLADGRSRLRGLLAGADPRSTAGAMRDLGADIPALPADGAEIVVTGRGLRGLRAPDGPLDLGNSGTGARLTLGVLAGQRFDAVVDGDGSLRQRPMRRVTDPLESMGASFVWEGERGRLPLCVRGGELRALDYDLPVASAQVKSSLLLAGLVGGVSVQLTEPDRSRDHTERMFELVGARLVEHASGPGWRVELRDPPERIDPLDFLVPGDFSSAAFFIGLAALGGAGDELRIERVGLNPTRTGLLDLLERMGADVEVEREQGGGEAVGEPIGTVRVRPSSLRAVEVGAAEVTAAIDEIPLLAVLAARAEGLTRITGAGELRVKETDRIRALAENLRAVGVDAEELEDGLEIRGTDRPPRGRVRAFDDHRIAMAFGVLGALPRAEIVVDDPTVVGVSYPSFWDDLRRLDARGPGPSGRRATPASGTTDPAEHRVPPPDAHASRTIVTLDGPAGSGKSTTAREVARRLGYRYLDSGALYRALTWALLASGRAPETWDALSTGDLDALGVRVEPTASAVRVYAGQRPLGPELRDERVTARVSRLAALPAVRSWLLGAQRRAGSQGRLVADGRDTGTVVFPNARAKIFLEADPRERARRRLGDKGMADPSAEELERERERLEERDRRDREREHAPLRIPAGALRIDTTRLDFVEQVDLIVDYARSVAEDSDG